MITLDISTPGSARDSLLKLLGCTDVEAIDNKLFREDRALQRIQDQMVDHKNVTVRGFHYSTINGLYSSSFDTVGVAGLFVQLSDSQSAIYRYLKDFGILIDTNSGIIRFMGKKFNIVDEAKRQHEGSAEYAWLSLNARFSRDYGVNAFLADAVRDYSVIGNGPEILFDLDNALQLGGRLFQGWTSCISGRVVIDADIPFRKLKDSNDWRWLVSEMISRGFPESDDYDEFFANHYSHEDILYLNNDERITPDEIRCVTEI